MKIKKIRYSFSGLPHLEITGRPGTFSKRLNFRQQVKFSYNRGLETTRYFLFTKYIYIYPFCTKLGSNVFSTKELTVSKGSGTKFAPDFANIFMGHLEEKFFRACELKPWVWWRFLDDIFVIWLHSEEELNIFCFV
jgi:hypothetical protein